MQFPVQPLPYGDVPGSLIFLEDLWKLLTGPGLELTTAEANVVLGRVEAVLLRMKYQGG